MRMTRDHPVREGERATFIVRLWRSASGEDWHGQVEHVQTGERRAAPDLAAALAAVRRWLALLTL